MRLEVVISRLIFALFVALLAGCKDKEPVGGTNGDFPSAPSGLAFSFPNGGMTFFNMSDGRLTHFYHSEGWSASAAAINAQGTQLIAVDASHSRVLSLTLPQLNEGPVIPLGGNPIDLQINPSGSIAYVITVNANLWICSFASGGRVVDTLEIGNAPRRETLRPPTYVELWLACGGDTSLRIIALGGLQTVDTIKFGRIPSAIAFSPDGSDAFIALTGSPGIVQALDAASRSALYELVAGTGPFDLAISSDGRYLAAADSTSGRVRFWDLPLRNEIGDVFLGGAAGRIRYSQSTNSFFVCVSEMNKVMKIDMSSGSPVLADTISVAPVLQELVLWETNN